jgi:hypothetical protein
MRIRSGAKPSRRRSAEAWAASRSNILFTSSGASAVIGSILDWM